MTHSLSIRKVFSESLKGYFKVIPEVLKYFLPFFLPLGILNQLCLKFADGGDESARIYGSIGSMLVSTVSYFLMILLVPYLFRNMDPQKRDIGEHIRSYLSPISIESLRAMGSIALGLLFFLIPGFIRMVQYMFIPFVVQFHEDYKKGSADALKISQEICKGAFTKICIVLTLIQIFVLPTEYAVMKWNIYQGPLNWFMAFVVQFCLQVLSVFIMYIMYEQLILRREKNGITV